MAVSWVETVAGIIEQNKNIILPATLDCGWARIQRMFPELVSQGCDGKAEPTGESNEIIVYGGGDDGSDCADRAATGQCSARGPWCAHVGIGDDSYIERCDMLSYEMCRTEIFAQGGAYCTQNPRFRASAETRKQRKAKRDNR